MVALDETDVLDLGADLDDERGTLDLQILDDRDTVAVLKDVTHGVANGQPGLGGLGNPLLGPLMGAFGANVHSSVFVGEFGIALGALGQDCHRDDPQSKTANPKVSRLGESGGQSRNRTTDTRIFNSRFLAKFGVDRH